MPDDGGWTAGRGEPERRVLSQHRGHCPASANRSPSGVSEDNVFEDGTIEEADAPSGSSPARYQLAQPAHRTK